MNKSMVLTGGWYLVDDFLARIGVKSAEMPSGDHLSGEAIDADIAYAENVVQTYSRHGAVKGRVAEIGPGGNAITGLLLVDEGAESVELLDRFEYPHDQALLDRTYSRIIDRSPKLKALFPSTEELAPRINFSVGEEAAAEIYFLANDGYDAICSCAVFEHLTDPITALRRAAAALNPGGSMVHYVDFRDHGMFTASGAHELTFLKIPGWLYPFMSRHRGRPNRVLIDQYRKACEDMGLGYKLMATSLVGVGLIDETPVDEIPDDLRAKSEKRVAEIRDQLALPFRKMPLSELAIDGIALVATK